MELLRWENHLVSWWIFQQTMELMPPSNAISPYRNQLHGLVEISFFRGISIKKNMFDTQYIH
jgi:hypothetical protein